MKKLFAVMAALSLLAALTGCSDKKPAETVPNPAPTEPSVTEPAVQEPVQAISQVHWLVNDSYDLSDQWNCQYDAASNTLNITGKVFDPIEIEFYEGGSQVLKETHLDADGKIRSQKKYDEQGNLTFELDEDGYCRKYTYENGLMMTEEVYLDGSQPISEGSWRYDDAGRKIAYMEEADEGRSTQQEIWVYDGDGNLIDHRLDSSYDGASWYQYEIFNYRDGLLVSSTHEGEDPANSWDYTVDYSYDDQGRKISALLHNDFYGDAEDIWEYDDQGNLIKSVEHYPMDGWGAMTEEYEYDDAGRLIREYSREDYQYSDEPFYWSEILYIYDDAGRLTESSSNYNDNDIITVSYEYDAQGNRTLYSIVDNGEEDYRLACEYNEEGKLVWVERNGEETLVGPHLFILSGGDQAEFVMDVKYETTPAAAENAAEIATVNDFILQYIQKCI